MTAELLIIHILKLLTIVLLKIVYPNVIDHELLIQIYRLRYFKNIISQSTLKFNIRSNFL